MILFEISERSLWELVKNQTSLIDKDLKGGGGLNQDILEEQEEEEVVEETLDGLS